MDSNKKYNIILICFIIIGFAFVINILVKNLKNRDIKVENNNGKEENIEGIISLEEAFNFLDYIYYDGIGRENLNIQEMKLSEGLKYSDLKLVFDHLIINNKLSQEIYSNINFEDYQTGEYVKFDEFIAIYEKVIQMVEDSLVKEENLFILGSENIESEERIISNKGKYRDTTNLINKDYLLTQIKALVSGNFIIYFKGKVDEPIEFHNILIGKGSESKVDVFIGGVENQLDTIYPLSTEIENVIGDITIKDKKVVQISVKPDIISGKVLLTGKDFIEIEGYGKVPLDEEYKIYKIYGDLTLEPTNSILVGYDVTDFVVSNGKINAALIKDKIKAENIRVLILDDNFKSMYHEKVVVTSDKKFTISYGDKVKEYEANEKVTINKGDKLLKDGRLKVEASSEKARVEILSVERSYGNPRYRGVIEITEDSKGLFIVNELPLEEYLYAVIPSEMPTYYGVEALKVQAICARSYAYKQLMENKLKDYGAHVDDSISYQVYNNLAENEDSILAVKDTYGKVIMHNEEIITAYYFSTSCGHTTAIEHVWGGEHLNYLAGRLMLSDNNTITTFSNSKGDLIDYTDLSNEENFRYFIQNKDIATYDSEFNWYRWNVNLNIDNIRKVVDQKLSLRYQANSSLILTEVNKNGETSYESLPVDSIGEIKDMIVLKRGDGGIITELLIKGSKKNIKVLTEYNIRTLLAPMSDTVTRNDGTTVTNLSLLPSAFFVADRIEKDGKLESFKITGGGYGHGVGMSQNGVKAMVNAGMDYKEIIEYFYQGTSLGSIYK